MLTASALACDHQPRPAGVPVGSGSPPHFSWQLAADGSNVFQTARRLQVATDPAFARCVWDSGRTECPDSVDVPYAGPVMAPETKHWWRVRIWDNQGRESDWSETADFITALDGWTAPFVSGEPADAAASSAGTVLRGEFSLGKGIASAILHATALGVYRLSLNGVRVGDWAMTPGWTEYASRLLYQSYDVTAMLREGANAVGAMIGNGWYKGSLAGWLGLRNLYGKQTAFAMRLTVRYADGTTTVFQTGPEWKAADGPVLFSEIYDGETYDATREIPGWDAPGFDASGWRAVLPVAFDSAVVRPQDGPPVRARERLRPAAIFTAPNGEKIIDFGQVVTGWVRVSVAGKAGDAVRIRHAETLDRDGNFYTANLRSAKQQIKYVLKGGAEEVYEPYFTFQGFRYICVDEFPGAFGADNFTAVVAHSDMPEICAFDSSHDKLNRLMQNIRWGMKGNFFDIPTDCPQRDERLGWTGDAQVFVRAASILHDASAFFRKWLRDMAAAQFPDGAVPHVVPDILTGNVPDGDKIDVVHGTTGWGDAGVICPWTQYKYSGDRRFLEECYPMMKGWVEFIRSRAQWGLIWNRDRHLGDWVALDAKEGSYFGATPVDLIATAYYAHATSLTARAAGILGRDDEAREYARLRERIGDAFVKEFFSPAGRLAARTQTGYVLALHFGLVPEEHRARVLRELAEVLAEYGDHLSTGFLGTPYICHALSENGRLDLAYKLLLNEDYPSWLYPLSKGATTIWEHWDGIKPDGTMWSDDMNSLNHYAYGAIADWIVSVVAGIDSEAGPGGAGYRRSVVRPRPGGGLTRASAAQKTPYGTLSSAWTLDGTRLTLEVTVPHNTAATVVLPAGDIVENGGLAFAFNGGGQAATAPSGAYRFVVENAILA